MQQINGGRISPWGWLIVAAEELTDVITSGGDNLREAYQNGRETVGAK